MMDYVIKYKKEILSIKDSAILEKDLYSIFVNNHVDTIYVEEDNSQKISGIITIGDYYRYKTFRSRNLVNRHFRFVYEAEWKRNPIVKEGEKYIVLNAEMEFLWEISLPKQKDYSYENIILKKLAESSPYTIMDYLYDMGIKIIIFSDDNQISRSIIKLLDSSIITREYEENESDPPANDILIIDTDESKYIRRRFQWDSLGYNYVSAKDFLRSAIKSLNIFNQFCDRKTLLYYLTSIIKKLSISSFRFQLDDIVIISETGRLTNDIIRELSGICKLHTYKKTDAGHAKLFISLNAFVSRYTPKPTKESIYNYEDLLLRLQTAVEHKKVAESILGKWKNKYYIHIYELPNIKSQAGQLSSEKVKFLMEYNANIFQDPERNTDIFFPFFRTNDLNYIKELLPNPKAAEINGLCINTEFHSKYKNILSGGERYTVGQPEKANKNIFFVGPCTIYGNYVEDKFTLSSYLQEKINQSSLNTRVYNYGLIAEYQPYLRIENLYKNEKDIIIEGITNLYTFIYQDYNIKVNKLDKLIDFTGQNEKNWLSQPKHCNYVINEKIADLIFKTIQTELASKCSECTPDRDQDFHCIENNELAGYLRELEQYSTASSITHSQIGSIVMNANPLTKGHEYLIDFAAKSCDKLYIFVVEEDRSYFSFEQRYQMVCNISQKYNNITVLPSGKYIISTITFPEYFEKEEQNNVIINATQDLNLFGKYICKVLNINIRFVGEEPNDKITRQYNNRMKEILPSYGIKVCEIPRLSIGGRVISATEARNNLSNSECLKTILPETTLKILQETCK